MIKENNKLKIKYCDKHDAYFNADTGSWLEDGGKDVKCLFCSNRPQKHTPHLWLFIDSDKERMCK